MVPFGSEPEHKARRPWSWGKWFAVFAAVPLTIVAGYLLLVILLGGEMRLNGRPLTEAEKTRMRLSITNAVGAYDATTGAPINPALVTGLGYATEVYVAGKALYVTSVPGDSHFKRGRIGKYDATTGAPVNVALVDNDVVNLEGMAVVGNRLYVVALDHRVRVYDATTGAAVSGGFTCAFNGPSRLVLVGNHFLLPDYNGGRIASYDAGTGKPVDAAGIEGVPNAQDIVSSGEALYVLSRDGTVGKYDAATRKAIDPTLILGLIEPSSLAVSNGTVYISNRADNTVTTYDANTGACLTRSLIQGLVSPSSLAVAGNTLYVMQHR